MNETDDRDESCCSIDYAHHKEVFEKRREAFRADPSKAITVHEARIRLLGDHLKEAKTSEGYTILCDEPNRVVVPVRAPRRSNTSWHPSDSEC